MRLAPAPSCLDTLLFPEVTLKQFQGATRFSTASFESRCHWFAFFLAVLDKLSNCFFFMNNFSVFRETSKMNIALMSEVAKI